MNVGAMLKYYRVLYNLTQSEVAEMSGINEKYLGRIERNESVPTIDKVEQLCMAFDIRVADLLTPTFFHGYTPICYDSDAINSKTIKYYCNCCGEEFTSTDKEVICPNCLCTYDPENGFIEKYMKVE